PAEYVQIPHTSGAAPRRARRERSELHASCSGDSIDAPLGLERNRDAPRRYGDHHDHRGDEGERESDDHAPYPWSGSSSVAAGGPPTSIACWRTARFPRRMLSICGTPSGPMTTKARGSTESAPPAPAASRSPSRPPCAAPDAS